ncbi:undecaprenyldiphospho-muramoylpentapeptide beta-N-acetylglucosaminyltransferase [Jeotgalibacillus terrae]|uniref:UDP-N-acetylglucosamine--N-acetylmuramyl-(pentapeptide) pyrophosphoryl-undecaprenol N-acetylglucosamine transferase n=1 Tax=Jeotgalibacillus terrae TaxID=587735 RepID=A0ABW5ZK79_9BACL|nr:undecaprenyldiphospho-muramoylpentapeptide beta-N-acetylglucosaminyltransferase [Jeotgalibacillus terrae]MBM7577347.1 UDP-N-acetylglucosamine--N-acetylmuramyl-(pentapeptide) pyrophosphoryl-undecaprenol N-acetylglucosamine transferase [Jeotgalibacillus terrae]
MKKILFTGGGSAGHVSVNTALIPEFMKNNWQVSYIGSHDGIEKDIITKKFSEVPYYGISSGKLRRYFSIKNFTDPFRVLAGTVQAFLRIKKIKPDVIFSKGGFVSVPVLLAAKMAGVPVAIHESDVTPGLANKLAMPFATKIYTTFYDTLQYVPKEKSTCAGAIIREELFAGSREKGIAFSGLDQTKPIILVMGGSLGAKGINATVRSALHELTQHYSIIHLCGKGNVINNENPDYIQYEFVSDELPDLIAAADLVISRAGSNSIFEFLALKKPMILIPLSKEASRGDQILNANSFVQQGFALKLEEENLTEETLLTAVRQLRDQQWSMIEKMDDAPPSYTISQMAEEITRLSTKSGQ